MSAPKKKPDSPTVNAATADADASTGSLSRVFRFFGRLRAWAAGHWLRSVVVAGTILVLIAGTMAGWAYLASAALKSGEMSIDGALLALDEGRYEEARSAVGAMLKSGRTPRDEYGGPLFVLGAIKTHDAEQEAGVERRRIDYLVASRYLKEADAYGLPAGRELDGLFLLGKSLVESGQFVAGIRKLNELLATPNLAKDHPMAWEAHRLLSNTCLLMPSPDTPVALQHTKALLTKKDLPDKQQASAQLQLAECFTRLDRFDEAQQAVAAVPASADRQGDVALMKGKITLDEINAALERVSTQERSGLLTQSATKLAEAMKQLDEALDLDEKQTQITRQAAYQIGRGLALQNQTKEALRQFAKGRTNYSDTFEGLAAALAEADLLRQSGDFDGALLAYRRVLESYPGNTSYRSVVLSLPDLRERVMVAVKNFVGKKRFADALELVERFPPLFTRREQLEVRGDTLERWGDDLLQSNASDEAVAAQNQKDGLRNLRAAGLAFEQLSDLRFATRSYGDDLWHSADVYFRGHSFTSAVRLLDKYLDTEPELRNADALLRLGQAHLALGQMQQAIAAFEECIEFHPLNSATFQARIDCAKAYWNDGNTTRAEQLLRDNLAADSLRPTSREWKDSQFELGMLLHEMGRYDDAIGTLEMAVERYSQDEQRLASQYVIGESYRRWAQQLLDRQQQARTENERTKVKEVAGERLTTALTYFEEVQRAITLKTHDIHKDPLMGTMLRNCYMLEGSVLFDLGALLNDKDRFKQAIEAYSNVASLYPDEPFVLETFVQIANCWRRLNLNDKARGSIQQAQIALERLPPNADFQGTTSLNRNEWQMLLTDMSTW